MAADVITIANFTRQQRVERRLFQRARIILLCSQGCTGAAIAEQLSVRANTVSRWIQRWLGSSADDAGGEDCEKVLGDLPRPGAPPTFTVEQYVAIVALACEPRDESGCPISNWSRGELRFKIGEHGAETSAVVDGRVFARLAPGDRVRIERAEPTFKLIEVEGRWYYRTLRDKLGWGGDLPPSRSIRDRG